MKQFEVVWTITVSAECLDDAAVKAREIQLDPNALVADFAICELTYPPGSRGFASRGMYHTIKVK